VGKVRLILTGWVSASGSPPAAAMLIFIRDKDGHSFYGFFETERELYQNSGGGNRPSGLGIGYNGSSEFSDADIAEIIVYNSCFLPAIGKI